mmetsp:Transcript_4088/g.6628  ORF Transcript_4088/g.6628 Transcript_4088/m.6628 type:complete len:222 (+) Transcript_4088:192-857(+)
MLLEITKGLLAQWCTTTKGAGGWLMVSCNDDVALLAAGSGTSAARSSSVALCRGSRWRDRGRRLLLAGGVLSPRAGVLLSGRHLGRRRRRRPLLLLGAGRRLAALLLLHALRAAVLAARGVAVAGVREGVAGERRGRGLVVAPRAVAGGRGVRVRAAGAAPGGAPRARRGAQAAAAARAGGGPAVVMVVAAQHAALRLPRGAAARLRGRVVAQTPAAPPGG